jgi:hypothetical protein
MEIRKLNAGDVRKIAAIMAKNASALTDLPARDEGEPEEVHQQRVGIAMFSGLLASGMDDVWAFLASVAQMGVDEFDAQEPDAPLKVIEAIVDGGQFPGFFVQASALFQRAVPKKSGTRSPRAMASRPGTPTGSTSAS